MLVPLLQTALHVAAGYGMLRESDLLLRCEANLEIVDRWSSNPIFDAVKGNQQHIVELFKSKGASVP